MPKKELVAVIVGLIMLVLALTVSAITAFKVASSFTVNVPLITAEPGKIPGVTILPTVNVSIVAEPVMFILPSPTMFLLFKSSDPDSIGARSSDKLNTPLIITSLPTICVLIALLGAPNIFKDAPGVVAS